MHNIANPLSSSIRELTSKLQSTGLISQSVDGELNIHTDTVAVVNAEEALESPRKSDTDNSDYQKKLEMYNKIGHREFEDTILFKHHKRKKKKTPMSASIISLSSSGSDEKDSACIHSTLMNLSTVGILPDLRSPESIKNDIEYKEKILANVLSFDKVNVSVEETKEETLPVVKEVICDSNKCNEEIVDIEKLPEVEDNREEFSIKPFKHIFPEFDKLKHENLEVAKAPGKYLFIHY